MAAPLQWPQMDPEQQSLLLAALTSNRPKPGAADAGIDPSVFDAPLSSDFDLGSFDDSALQDFVGNDDNLDSNDNMGSDLPAGSPLEGEGGEKRKSFSEDEDDIENGDPKRRDSSDSVSKKPGRKPITAEPTTKRKAQNRAAQRAFRERKEQHLKNLETKVLDLERASESANHENSMLRAQVERLQTELKEYRKRISQTGFSSASPPRNDLSIFGRSGSGSAPVDFDFDFPRFGGLPGSQMPVANSNSNTNALQSFPGGDKRGNNANAVNGRSGSLNSRRSNQSNSKQNSTDALGDLFKTGSSTTLNDNNFGFPSYNSPEPMNNDRSQSYNSNRARPSPSVSGSATSPSSSGSQLYQGSSSCTSPESLENWATGYSSTDNQITKQSTSNSTPGLTNAKTPGSDFNNNFDWLANQNGGQFDPVLFGDYRDTQNAIIGTNDFSGGFFEDGLPFPDMNDPFDFNMAADATIPASIDVPSAAAAKQKAKPAKVDLMEQVRRQREGEDEPVSSSTVAKQTSTTDTTADQDRKSLMTCHKIWNQLQTCPRFKDGDFDIDGLCTELASKARCTETGVAVPKADVEKALWRLAGAEPQGDRLASMHFPGHEGAEK